MKIAICEDQDIQTDLLNKYIREWSNEKDINISIDNFTNAESFLFQWSDDYDKYDIIFLDIKLGEISGIDLSNMIRKKIKQLR